MVTAKQYPEDNVHTQELFKALLMVLRQTDSANETQTNALVVIKKHRPQTNKQIGRQMTRCCTKSAVIHDSTSQHVSCHICFAWPLQRRLGLASHSGHMVWLEGISRDCSCIPEMQKSLYKIDASPLWPCICCGVGCRIVSAWWLETCSPPSPSSFHTHLLRHCLLEPSVGVSE